MKTDAVVLIKGAGDLATGIAWRLTRSGFRVAMTELPHPLAIRRKVAFAEAIYAGETTVEGVTARLARGLAGVRQMLDSRTIPVLVDPLAQCRTTLHPEILIDAIVAKRNEGTKKTDAPLVIALGPGFVAGTDCHAVIETRRGHRLGRVLWRGPATPNDGVPGTIGGQSAGRVLRAPCAGHIEVHAAIGDLLHEGDRIAAISGHPIRAPFDGVLRGLIHPAVAVHTGMKIGDVDPRGNRIDCFTISDKALAIAGGVLEAVLSAGHSKFPFRS
ncbi:MAG: EF2563 family selenium-dependent molybdenum hydroxylase system protein [Chloroflexi bacterium]|nr:EF2563 family selenium-dependent molybdenum hydroxylase system protein [Chloroflexota bacterium]